MLGARITDKLLLSILFSALLGLSKKKKQSCKYEDKGETGDCKTEFKGKLAQINKYNSGTS